MGLMGWQGAVSCCRHSSMTWSYSLHKSYSFTPDFQDYFSLSGAGPDPQTRTRLAGATVLLSSPNVVLGNPSQHQFPQSPRYPIGSHTANIPLGRQGPYAPPRDQSRPGVLKQVEYVSRGLVLCSRPQVAFSGPPGMSIELPY